MSGEHYEQSFAGVSATGETAREVRRRINSDRRYQRGPTYLHEWHDCLNDLLADVAVLCVGMDVGGFPRNLLHNFTRRGIEFTGRVVGLDFEPTRVRRLQNEFRGDPRLCFCVDDPETVRFADGTSRLGCGSFDDRSFDIAICTYALHDRDVLKPERAVEGLARMLKSDGLCMVATHARGSFPEVLEIYRQVCRDLGLTRQAEADFTHFDNFAQEDAARLLSKHFEEVEFRPVDTSLVFEGRDSARDFMEYCDYFPFPHLAGKEVTESLRGVLRERFEAAAVSRMEASGRLTISKPSGVFMCRRPRLPGVKT
jgi:SAM-dependent methyltransferase